MTIRVNVADVLRMRLAAHGLTAVPAMNVVDTARRLLAIQAQDFGQALWALGARARGAARADVLRALSAGEIVRSATLRGTLHFLPAEDLRWMLALTASRTLASAATRFRELGLDDATFDRAAELAHRALAGGGALGRNDFLAVLARGGIPIDGQRGYHIIFALSQRALICWGPPEGTQQAIVLVDEWIPAQPDRGRDDALRELAVRYFSSRGPATERDFAWWAKLPISVARSAIGMAADDLAALELRGERYWAAEAAEPAEVAASARGNAVHLLPGFDEYLLGYQDRSLVLAQEHSQRIVPGGNGIFLPVIVSAGRVVGTWRRPPRGALAIEPFGNLSSREARGVEVAAARYERFLGGTT